MRAGTRSSGRDDERDFILRALERPVVAGGHVLDHLERVVALIAFVR
jgi:hypothetical protein